MLQLALKIVTEHINEWDPERLLEGGAPDDEYEVEIEEIAEAVVDSRDEIEIAEAIEDTFVHYFGREYSFDDCYEVANKIWRDLYE